MINLIRIFDIIASVTTVITLNLVSKTYKAWLFYCIGCIFFTIVCFSKSLFGLTIMGIILFITGLRNYYSGRINAKEKRR